MKTLLKLFFLFCTVVTIVAGLYYTEKKIREHKSAKDFEGYIERLFSSLDKDVPDYLSELKGLMQEYKTAIKEGGKDIESAKIGYSLSRQLAIVCEVRKEYRKKLEKITSSSISSFKGSSRADIKKGSRGEMSLREYEKMQENRRNAEKQKKDIEFRKKFFSDKIYKDWNNYVYNKKPLCIKLLKKMREREKVK